MLTSYVHPRLGLPKFLTFEPFFVTALRAFDRGEDTRFDITGGLSPSTIAARMRDSIQGYRLNHTTWTDRVDPEFITLFTKHDGKFVISGPNEQGEVWFRTKQKQGGHLIRPGTPSFHEVEGQINKYVATKSVISSRPTTLAPLRAKDCFPETVAHFAALKANGHLELAVIFPGAIDTDTTAKLLSVFDIAFHFDSQRNETILV